MFSSLSMRPHVFTEELVTFSAGKPVTATALRLLVVGKQGMCGEYMYENLGETCVLVCWQRTHGENWETESSSSCTCMFMLRNSLAAAQREGHTELHDNSFAW